jgi:serine/threonine protein phosphatase PrpC
LLAVFDGMGGAGGTVYETEDGPRSGAYLASRIARDVVERRMLDLLVPDWNLNGPEVAEDLRRSVQEALSRRLVELKSPPSRLRSKLLRALPTTMSVLALQRGSRDLSTWLCHVFWAGDSRGYVLEPDGAHQLTIDDLRDSNDALTNLRRDSVVSNAISADTEFRVNYRRVELQAPFVLTCATDGCFGYLPTPMHFEHLVLSSLAEAHTVEAWSRAIQTKVASVTGDDAAMSVVAVGADLEELRTLYASRTAELEDTFTAPIDALDLAVHRAERELTFQRERQLRETERLWGHYRPGYERYLTAANAHAVEEGQDSSGPATTPKESGHAQVQPDGRDSSVDDADARDETPRPVSS